MNIRDLERYAYDLPDALIARRPASPRDAARLFVYDTARDLITVDTFRHLARYLPEHAFLVTNETRVLPARLVLRKETGGKAEILLLLNEWMPGDATIKALSDRKLSIGQVLRIGHATVFSVSAQEGKIFRLKPHMARQTLLWFLAKHGTTPIPKYLSGGGLQEHTLRLRYQSVFARRPASVAAPTASLHFTQRLLRDLERKGIYRLSLALHVGMGTFAPIGEEQMKHRKLFPEAYDIGTRTAQNIWRWGKEGRPLIAVGTTTVRALESAGKTGRIEAGRSSTQLFIRPPYRFRVVDGLITNFHLPRSSLMLLVDAFLRHKRAQRDIRELYRVAIAKRFRFYSFGDAMLIR